MAGSKRPKPEAWRLRLYVAGGEPASVAAIACVQALCEERLADRHDLEVIDLTEHEARARADEILAVPTLIKAAPPPAQRLVGDLSDGERLRSALGLA